MKHSTVFQAISFSWICRLTQILHISLWIKNIRKWVLWQHLQSHSSGLEVAAAGFYSPSKVSFESEADDWHRANFCEVCSLLKGYCSPSGSVLFPCPSRGSLSTSGLPGGFCSHTGMHMGKTDADFALTTTGGGREQILPGQMQQDQLHAWLHRQDQRSSRIQLPISEHEDTSISAASVTWKQSVSSWFPEASCCLNKQGHRSCLRSDVRVQAVPIEMPSLPLLLCYAVIKQSPWHCSGTNEDENGQILWVLEPWVRSQEDQFVLCSSLVCYAWVGL